MPSKKTSTRTLRTSDITCKILFAIRELDGANLIELANYFDRSKSGMHHHVSTLIENDLVVKQGNEYNLSSQFLQFGEYVRQSSDLYKFGREIVDNLAAESGEYAHLMYEERGYGIHLYKSQAKNSAADNFYRHKTTKSDYLHFSAAGKAILAHMPHDRVEEIIENHGLVSKTKNTISNRDRLLEELETIQSQNYALNDEEEVLGTRAVGSAVLDSDGSPLGGLSVSGPTTRITDEQFYEILPKDVIRAANIIEDTLDIS